MTDTSTNPGRSIAFVASGQIPASPPPSSAVGPVKWLKDNLFSSIGNTILTLISVILIAFLAAEILPWLIDSSWTPEEMSLKGCRAEASGACFAVIVDRFWQFIFGFYPSELYWRPTIAFILLVFAFWPVLFANAPRQLLILTAVYPVLAYWLIWGGTIWGPLLVLAGPVIGWMVLQRGGEYVAKVVGEDFGPLVTMITAVLTVIIWFLFVVAPVDGAISSIQPIGLEEVASDQLGGFLLSMIIGVVGIVASLPLGVALALGRQSKLLIVRSISVGFIEAMRGVPLITLLFVASVLFAYFLPPGTTFDLILRVCIMVTLFASAYMAEVIRGGIAALPTGQYEAADAMGLTYWQSMQLIILPQALKISIPNIVSTFIGLFKDTTLVIVIGLLDPIGLAGAIRADAAWNGIVWEIYGFIALFFFVFCFGMSRYSQYLERKLATDHR
ncbi:MAG: amino acid ABC transporter permease [Pseudomonadota bacterium]